MEIMDCEPLHAIFREWLANCPRRLERAAAARDVDSLLQQAPLNPTGLIRQGFPGGVLLNIQSLLGLLRGPVANL